MLEGLIPRVENMLKDLRARRDGLPAYVRAHVPRPVAEFVVLFARVERLERSAGIVIVVWRWPFAGCSLF